MPAAAIDKSMKNTILDVLIISLGIAIYAFGFCVFILPHHIVIGGMTGVGTLVYYASFQKIPIAVTMYGANIILLLIGWRMLGKGFLIRTIYGATLISLLIGLGEGYFSSHPPLITSAPMSIIMGSVLLGLGIGMYYSRHGTSGGSDIVAAIMAHKTTMSMGRVLMIFDMSIVALSFLLPFDGDWEQRLQVRTETIIYGWLSIMIYSMLADKYVADGKQTIQFIILSDKWEEIAERITHETGRGVTSWEARGYWTGQRRTLIITWCRKHDLHQITKICTDVDPKAFISTNNVKGVYGQGFDRLRVAKRNILQ